MSDSPAVVAQGTINVEGAAPAAPVEAPKPEETKKPDPFAPKFAALTRKERELSAMKKQIEADKKAIEAEKAEHAKWKAEREKESGAYKDKFKQNPFEFLDENGLPFDQLVEMKLNDGKMTPERMIQKMQVELESKYGAEIEALKNQLKEEKENEEKEKFEQTVSGFKAQISEYLAANADTYELIHAEQAEGLVYEVIEAHYQETGRVLKIEDAAKATEEHLEEDVRRKMELKKFKQTSTSTEAKESKGAPTLSNTMSSEVPVKGEKRMSKDESLKNAARMIRWNT